MGAPDLFRPYYYGKHRWDDYLLDIEGAAQANANLQRQRLRTEREANIISQQQLKELGQLRDDQNKQAEEIRSQLEELQAEIGWGFSLIADQMAEQTELLSQTVEKLEAIHKTLRSPLITQATELWRLGEEWFHKKLYDKALHAFLQSAQKNDVNFALQFRIGTVYFEGRTRDCNVIDLHEAEKHFILAARYAQAESGTISKWQVFCGKS